MSNKSQMSAVTLIFGPRVFWILKNPDNEIWKNFSGNTCFSYLFQSFNMLQEPKLYVKGPIQAWSLSQLIPI